MQSAIEVGFHVQNGTLQARLKVCLYGENGSVDETLDFRGTCNAATDYCCGPLQFKCEEPYCRWQLTFNGPITSSLNRKVHMRCNLMWRSYSIPVEVTDADVMNAKSDVSYHVWGLFDGWIDVNSLKDDEMKWVERTVQIANCRGVKVRHVVHSAKAAAQHVSADGLFIRLDDGKCMYVNKPQSNYLIVANGYPRPLSVKSLSHEPGQLIADFAASRTHSCANASC
jgi:hypothetical protein